MNWSLVWIALSFLFNGLFWWAVKDCNRVGRDAPTPSRWSFLTGYLIEKSLAVDNIFLFLDDLHLFCGAHAVSEARADDWHHWRHRAAHHHDPGGRLVAGAVPLDFVRVWRLPDSDRRRRCRMAADHESDLDNNPALKLLRKFLPVSENYDGENVLDSRKRQEDRHASVHGDLSDCTD